MQIAVYQPIYTDLVSLASANRGLLARNNSLLVDGLSTRPDDFAMRQLSLPETSAIKKLAPGFAAEFYREPDTMLSPQQVKAAEYLLTYAAEQMVDRGFDRERVDHPEATAYLMKSSYAGKDIGDTGQWMFVASAEH